MSFFLPLGSFAWSLGSLILDGVISYYSPTKGVPEKEYAFDIELYDEIVPEVGVISFWPVILCTFAYLPVSLVWRIPMTRFR